jgi:hypothetical protein
MLINKTNFKTETVNTIKHEQFRKYASLYREKIKAIHKDYAWIPRWRLEGEAESEPPIVKSWRDAEDTPCRQNHGEEAKL